MSGGKIKIYHVERTSWSEYVEKFEVKATSVAEAKVKFKSGERELIHAAYGGGDRDGEVRTPKLIREKN